MDANPITEEDERTIVAWARRCLPAVREDVAQDIRAAWLEMSYDKFDWQRVGRYMYRAPYFTTLERASLSNDMFYLRAAAVDGLENTGYSREISIPARQPEQAAPVPETGADDAESGGE